MGKIVLPFSKKPMIGEVAFPQKRAVNIDTAKRVAICIPAFDMLHTDFAMSLAAMCYNPGARLALIQTKSSRITHCRSVLAYNALSVGVEYLLYVDSDMWFPPNLLKELLAWDKDIVGATYPKRVPPYEILGNTLDGHEVDFARGGLVKMRTMPMGAMLVRASVFDQFKKPFFRFRPDEETGEEDGEDTYFCDRARELGFDVWLDVAMSTQLVHFGQSRCHIALDQKEEK